MLGLSVILALQSWSASLDLWMRPETGLGRHRTPGGNGFPAFFLCGRSVRAVGFPSSPYNQSEDKGVTSHGGSVFRCVDAKIHAGME
jgi:hypothetical protein